MRRIAAIALGVQPYSSSFGIETTPNDSGLWLLNAGAPKHEKHRLMTARSNRALWRVYAGAFER